MIRTPVKDSWSSPPPPGPSAKDKRCRSRREARASDKWEMDYSFSHFVRALVEERPEWQTKERVPFPEPVFYADKQVRRLRDRYEFRDDTAVEDFLGENPFLFDLLAEAHDRIREHFDSNTPVALDLVREPDAKNSGRLFILILTELRPKEAVDRLDKLDQGWWLGKLSAAEGKVTIDIDYG